MTAEHQLSELWIDHLGLAVHDVAPVVAALRNAGFVVNNPVELHGESGPMGQVSAHCVFRNFYLEISAPIAGYINHLSPILANGSGLAIIVLRCEEASLRHDQLSGMGFKCDRVMDASRSVYLSSGEQVAHFRWFPVQGLIDHTIVGFVEHRDAHLVFAPELMRHASGARQIERIAMGPEFVALAELANGRPSAAPFVALDETATPRACALVTDTGCDLLELCLEASV